MIRTAGRTTAFVVGLGLSGFLCSRAYPALTTPRGAEGSSIAFSSSPVFAMLTVVVCVLAASVVAGIVGRLFNAVIGWFVLGTGLFILASGLAPIYEIAFAFTNSSTSNIFFWLGLEGAFWTILVFAGVFIVFKLSGPLPDIEPLHHSTIPSPYRSVEAIKAASAGILILPVVWFLAQSALRGQTIIACTSGGLMAGLLGRLISPHVQPVLLCVSPVLFGSLALFLGMATINRPLDVAFVTHTIPTIHTAMPIDYAAGALLGVPMGLAWAKSFLHHPESPSSHAATSTS